MKTSEKFQWGAAGRRLLFGLLAACCVVLAVSCNDGNKNTGRLEIFTTPAGARLLWDGEDVPGVTTESGVRLENCLPGLHLLTIAKNGFEEERRTVKIVTGQMARVDVELREKKGVLLVESNPSGVEVRLQSLEKDKSAVLLGTTPFVLSSLAFGSHVLVFRKDGFDVVETPIQVDSRVPLLVNQEMKTRFASIKINTLPSGAAVFLDGELIGTTKDDQACSRANVLEGVHELTIEKEGFDKIVEKITIAARAEVEKSYKLKQSSAAMELDSEPVGADVFVNGKSAGKTPFKQEGMDAGTYTIKLTKRGFTDFEKEAVLEPGKTFTLPTIKLESNIGAIQLSTNPPDAQVFVDGQLMLTTKPDRQNPNVSGTAMIKDIPAGERIVEIVKSRYFKETKTVNVVKDQTTNMDVIMLEQMNDTYFILRPNIRVEGVIQNKFDDGSYDFKVKASSRGGYIIQRIRPEQIIEGPKPLNLIAPEAPRN